MPAQILIARLGLQPHPEGGHYRETFRAVQQVATVRGPRAASTAIHFLLGAGEVSRWHRVESDEGWHWYAGGPLELLTCAQPGAPLQRWLLGDVLSGLMPQAMVPAGHWQAARPLGDWVLMGCTVAPGFDFADFQLLDPADPDAAWFRAAAAVELVDGPQG
jgi:hypothetical protein